MASAKRDQILQEAEKLAARGKLDSAIKEYRRALEQSPHDTNTLNRLGDLLVRVNRVPEAIDVYQRIAEHFAGDGFFLKAIAIYKKVNRLDPQRTEVYDRLADLYFKQGLVVEGRQQLLTLADWFARARNLDDTIRTYRRLVELEPANLQARAKLVDLLIQKSDVPAATLEMDALGKSLLSKGMPDEALKLYSRALDLRPENLGFLVPCIDGLVKAGRAGQAAEFANRALALAHNDLNLRRAAANAYTEAGDPQRGRELLESVLPAIGERTDVVQLYGDIMLRVGESGLAKDKVLPAVDRLIAAGDKQRAAALLKRLLREASGDIDVLQRAMKIFTRRDDPDMALSIQAALADAYYRAQRKDEAVAAYRELVLWEPGNAGFAQRLQSLGGTVPERAAPPPERPAPPPPQPARAEAPPASRPAGVTPLGSARTQPPAEPVPAVESAEAAPEVEFVDVDLFADEAAAEAVLPATAPLPAAPQPPEEPVTPAPEPTAWEPAAAPGATGGFEFGVGGDFEGAAVEPDTSPSLVVGQPQAPLPPVNAPFVDSLSSFAFEQAVVGVEEDVTPAVSGTTADELYTEAMVFAKYGLVDKAVAHIHKLLSFEPTHALGRELLATLGGGEIVEVEPSHEVPTAEVAAEEPAAASPTAAGVSFEAVSPAPRAPGPTSRSGVGTVKIEELETMLGLGADAATAGRPPARRSAQATPEVQFDFSSLVAPTQPLKQPGPSRQDGVDRLLELGLPAPAAPPSSRSVVEPAVPTPVAPEPAAPVGAAGEAEGIDVLAEPVELLDVAEVLAGPTVEQLGEIDFFIEQGLLDEAARQLAKLRETFPDHPDMTSRQALLKARGWEEGVTPPSTESSAAELFSEEEQFFDLAAELEKELAEDEMVAEARGKAEGEVSIEELFKEFQRGVAEQVNAEDYDTHFNLGLAYREMGLLDEAVGEFQLAAKSEVLLIEACSMIGACYIDKGLPDEAAEWFTRALAAPALTPDAEIGLKYELARAQERGGNTAAALANYVQVLALNPGFRDVVDRVTRLQAN